MPKPPLTWWGFLFSSSETQPHSIQEKPLKLSALRIRLSCAQKRVCLRERRGGCQESKGNPPGEWAAPLCGPENPDAQPGLQAQTSGQPALWLPWSRIKA